MLVIRHGHVVFERAYPQDYEALFATAPDRHRDIYNYYDPEWHPFYKGRGCTRCSRSARA